MKRVLVAALVVLTLVGAKGGLRFHIPDGWKLVWEAPGAGTTVGAEERARYESQHVVLAAVEPSIPGATLNVSVLANEPVRTEAGLDAFVDGLKKTMGEGTVVSRGFMDVHGAKTARVVIDQDTADGAMRSAVYLLPGDHEQAAMVFRLPAARFEGARRRIEASVNETSGLANGSFARIDRVGKLAGTVIGAAVGLGVGILLFRRKKRAA